MLGLLLEVMFTPPHPLLIPHPRHLHAPLQHQPPAPLWDCYMSIQLFYHKVPQQSLSYILCGHTTGWPNPVGPQWRMGMGQQPTKLWPPANTSRGREIIHEPVSQTVHDRGLVKDEEQVRITSVYKWDQVSVDIGHRDQKDRRPDQTIGEEAPHIRQHMNMATWAIVAVELVHNMRHFSRICLSATSKPGWWIADTQFIKICKEAPRADRGIHSFRSNFWWQKVTSDKSKGDKWQVTKSDKWQVTKGDKTVTSDKKLFCLCVAFCMVITM